MADKRMVLMIDDDSMMLQKAYEILQEHFDVRQAKSAKQGYQLLARKQPDIILLDISMPDIDGYQALTEIRKMEKCEQIPVIFLTALEDAESEVKGISMGAVDYIHKPFVPEILLSRVKRHLENSLQTKSMAQSTDSTSVIEFDTKKLEEMKKVLTSTEFQVAQLVAAGYDNQEISEKLSISYSYAKQVVSKILAKLEISKRSEVRQFFCNVK